ncbi:flagellar assembly protein FliW [Paenibacillus sp. PR3]|uniref:Flagellar assembly factor FliW n=1 Tax=Paenibacillus terricola TaxID=2763503 RepID=A0ABR8MY67_9BACL|nr:flagellar assembly protein FliW [Paenibacillus terricola]MBD3920823.1 flagellar assembly protein FliW [Paenibacillus terricola]
MNVLINKKLDLGDSIFGFTEFRYFRVEEMDDEAGFLLLQSEENESVGFIVVSPFHFYQDYEFKLNDEVIAGLQIEKPDDVAVFTIVTINQPFSRSTINLVAPIVINIKTGHGRQVILNDTSYLIHSALFPTTEGGI